MNPALPEPAVAPAPVFAGTAPGGGRFEVFDRIEAIAPETWRAMFRPHWKDYRYYRTLEETFAAEFPQRYLILRDAAGEVRAIQPLFLVAQDITAGCSPRLRAMLRPLRRWLTFRLLMAGCVVGDGQIGARKGEDLPAVCEALTAALDLYARREGISLVLFKDLPISCRRTFGALTRSRRFTRVRSLPAVTLNLAGLSSFEDYLQKRLGKATRKSLRRKFRELEDLPPLALEVKTSIDEAEATQLHRLYEAVALRGDVHFEVFTREYFLSLGERMPDQTRYFIWRHEGRVVAFSFCTVFGDAIYDNDLGLDGALASPLHLYYQTFRDIVRWALAHGITRYYSAPFNYEPKLRLAMELTPLDLYARHRFAPANWALRLLSPLMAPTRQEPLLAQFPNAGQL